MTTTKLEIDLSHVPLSGDLSLQDIEDTCAVIEPEVEVIKALLAEVRDVATLITAIDAYNSERRDIPESEGGLYEIETITVNGLNVLIRYDRRGNMWLINPSYQRSEAKVNQVQEAVEPARTGIRSRLGKLIKGLFLQAYTS
ncbi:MAG: hypothetical protein WC924_00770 [Candidatus Gracilibacteria bacterium]